jgi:hypothetical protein
MSPAFIDTMLLARSALECGTLVPLSADQLAGARLKADPTPKTSFRQRKREQAPALQKWAVSQRDRPFWKDRAL